MNLPPLPELPRPKLFDWANEVGHITYSIFPPMHVPPRLGKYFTDDQVRELLLSHGRAVQEACAREVDARAQMWLQTCPADADSSAYFYKEEEARDCAAAIRNGVIREGEGR